MFIKDFDSWNQLKKETDKKSPSARIREGSWFYPIQHSGMRRTVILNQARALDRKRLEQKIFDLPEYELQKIKDAFTSLIQNS